MFKKIFTAITILLTACSNSNKNLEAWNGTYWGMSPEKVSKVLQQELKSAEKADLSILCYGQKYCKLFALNNYKIGSQTYKVFLLFVNNQLNNVELHCKKPHSDILKCYLELSQLLKSNYGEPTEIKKTEDYSHTHDGVIYDKYTWLLPNKKAYLSSNTCFQDCFFYFDNMTELIYSPNPKTFQASTPEFNPTDKNKL